MPIRLISFSMPLLTVHRRSIGGPTNRRSITGCRSAIDRDRDRRSTADRQIAGRSPIEPPAVDRRSTQPTADRDRRSTADRPSQVDRRSNQPPIDRRSSNVGRSPIEPTADRPPIDPNRRSIADLPARAKEDGALRLMSELVVFRAAVMLPSWSLISLSGTPGDPGSQLPGSGGTRGIGMTGCSVGGPALFAGSRRKRLRKNVS